MTENLKNKVREALSSVLPITIIISVLCLFFTPISNDVMVVFILGAVLLTIGMGLFSIGADMSLSLMGERIGASMSKSKKIWFVALIAFIVGTIATIAEPDLQVLSSQITQIPNIVLITTVGVGVGIFLAIAMLRIVFNIRLSRLLFILYLAVFVIAIFIPSSFLPMAFDAGGVTTGPLTVPFIMALGIGAVSIRGDKNSQSDSFGLIALCSVGPILTVMILSLIFKVDSSTFIREELLSFANSTQVGKTFANGFSVYLVEVLESMLPIVTFFFLFNAISLKLTKVEFIKIVVGFLYTYAGLVIFLTGVNVGFLPVGNNLGMAIMNSNNHFLIIIILALIGYFIVQAEPAVVILTKRVSDITDGLISEKTILTTLSIGMSMALVIGGLRAWFGIPFLCFIIPRILISNGFYFHCSRDIHRYCI